MTEPVKQKIDYHLFKRLIAYFSPYKRELIVAVILTLAGSGFTLLPALLSKYIIDSFIINENLNQLERSQGVFFWVIIYLLLLVLDFAFKFIKGIVTGRIGQKAIRDIRSDVFNQFQKLSVRYFDKNPIGRLMTRVTNDIEALNDMFTQGVVTIFGDLFMILGIIISLLWINIELSLVTFSVLPVLFAVSFIFRKYVRINLTKVRSLVAKLNAKIQENITGIQIIKIFNKEKEHIDSFEKLNREHTKAWVENVALYSLYFPVVEIISSFAIALILWNSAHQIHSATVSFGTIVLFIQMAQMFFRPISDLSEKYNIIQSAMAASERIFDVLDTPVEIAQEDHVASKKLFQGKIEFRNVWFSYKDQDIRDDDYVIRDLSFTVNAGQHMAIVGHTGAGKSTIISLLNRFYDIQKGEILIDDINIKQWDLKELRKQVAIVLQDIYLFSGSVYDNISLHSETVTKEAIEEAARLVYADSFIRNLPQGYHTQIKERGSILSTGQKQLLSFARALVFNPKLLILDEATSSIDSETESLIQSALERLLEKRSSIMIAHRLSTIKHADFIVVMHHGRAMERGSHQELMELKGLYYKLYKLQYDESSKLVN